MAEKRWQVSTYITDEKVYNDLKVYLIENNTTMCAALGAGLKALLAGKIDLDGNVIMGEANEKSKKDVTESVDAHEQIQQTPTENTGVESEVQKTQNENITLPQAETKGDSTSAEHKDSNAIHRNSDVLWQAVCDAQAAAHSATMGNISSAIDDWLIAITDMLGMITQG